ncbi:MAG: TrkH family potassium uptake protein, partial [Oscillospiraceae bacterium]|nr:TrkH family potassium uptake protein [Oscillospiraceae bacterium]
PFREESGFAHCSLIPAAVSLLCGLLLQLRAKRFPARRAAGRQQAVTTVIFFWLLMMLIGALPFLLGRQLDFIPALFESVSGWTTTGFTVMPDIDHTPHIFLFYRAFMQFVGGLGFVLLLLLFSGGRGAMGLFSAEGHSDMLEPNLVSTARATMYLYLGMVLGGAGLYVLFGMPWFDAINHSMSALGTGGFSPRSENIGYYESIPIEVVSIVLMLLGATNFAALALMVKGKLRKFLRLGEIRFFLVFLAAIVVLLAFLGLRGVYAGFGKSLRDSVFLAVSAVTTTGYSINTVDHWSPAMLFLIFVLMFIGGASGSTAGGIKYSRVYVLCKSFAVNLAGKFRPERSVSLLTVYGVHGKTRVSDAQLTQHQRVALIYLATFFLGAFLLTLDGMSLQDAVFDFASALGTIGLSSGRTGPQSDHYVLLVQIVGMILARMEVYVVYVFGAAGAQWLFAAVRRAVRRRVGAEAT